jgi:hypothetical protein
MALVHAQKVGGEQAASSPPVPGRISRMAGRASAASFRQQGKAQGLFHLGDAGAQRGSSSSARARISGSASIASASARSSSARR